MKSPNHRENRKAAFKIFQRRKIRRMKYEERNTRAFKVKILES